MKDCYVVLQTTGEYSDAITWAIGVFESQDQAVGALKTVGVKEKPWQGPDGNSRTLLERDEDDARFDIERVPLGRLEEVR